MRKEFKILGFFMLLLVIPLILAHGEEVDTYDGHHDGMMDGFYGGSGMWFGWIFMILIIIALILFIVWLVKQLTANNQIKRRRK